MSDVFDLRIWKVAWWIYSWRISVWRAEIYWQGRNAICHSYLTSLWTLWRNNHSNHLELMFKLLRIRDDSRRLLLKKLYWREMLLKLEIIPIFPAFVTCFNHISLFVLGSFLSDSASISTESIAIAATLTTRCNTHFYPLQSRSGRGVCSFDTLNKNIHLYNLLITLIFV